MFSEPRLYRDESDLDAMRGLLRQGRLANNGTYYVHPGDLNWWLFYPPLEYDIWQSIYLWDDPDKHVQIMAWALISPVGSTFDVFLRPELRGSPLAWEMYTWAVRRLTSVAKSRGREHIGVYWIAEEDTLLRGWLTHQGFELAKRDVHLVCELAVPGPAARVPDGYVVRSSHGLAEAVQQARAQYGAFSSTAEFERYVQRFTRFMQSPIYDPELDVVAVSPDGQVGAFCIVWPDPLTGVGLFEPVGTHPDFQRKGLGKAVMLEGLDRLQGLGMRQAIVSTQEDNLPAIKLYESVGFRIIRRLLYYKLEIN
jgi:mycothiol synthase